MSSTGGDEKKAANGRPRKPARTPRGERILALLDEKGMTLKAAAELAGVSSETIFRVIHEHDPSALSVGTVTRVCEGLGLPLELVAPCMSKLVAS